MENKFLNKLTSFFFYVSILTLIISFNFAHNPPSGWQQQFLPNLNNRPLVDITFTDSLTGYAIASNLLTPGDTSFVLKSTNGGNNWNVILSEFNVEYRRVIFLNSQTGYIGGGTYSGGFPYLLKTTNSGLTWEELNTPNSSRVNDMSVLNEDTIWFADPGASFDGGIYRTTNGGLNWVRQFQIGSVLERIYMYNRNIGFASTSSFIFKTTNSGINWNIIPAQNGFHDIYFIDSLNGWKSYDSMRITTDGGLTWKRQFVSNSNILSMYGTLVSFSNIGNDTIFGVGFRVEFPNLQIRSIVHFTTNKGENWLYQIPDTSFKLPLLKKSNFVNNRIGWEYATNQGIHTVTGGDSIFQMITGINQNSMQNALGNFRLFQNYPNPFNPKTRIKYELKSKAYVKLSIFDIQGKEFKALINKKQSPGNYEIEFDGGDYSTGIYFYKLEVNNGDESFSDAKSMILIK